MGVISWRGADRSSSDTRFVTVVAGISALGGLLFGYDTGVISGAILFIQQDFGLSATLEEIVISSVLLDAVIGAAIGVASFTAPLYISEVSPVNIRGRLVSLNQIALTAGIVISYLMDYELSGVRGWRWMFGLAAIPAPALGIGMLFVPESPRLLVGRALPDKARAVLRRVCGTPDVDRELKEIQTGLDRQGGRWSELLSPSVRPALIVGIGLAVFQQVTGINTVIYYAPTIFQFAGFTSASVAILATVGVGAVNVLMTIGAMLLLDRVGRRPLLLIGLVGMALGLGLLGLAFSLPSLRQQLGWIAVGSCSTWARLRSGWAPSSGC